MRNPLDVAAADAWLKAQVDGLQGDPEVTQFGGGASNWTYGLRYPGADLVLRRPPDGTKARSAHDMAREYRVQQALRPYLPWVPEVLALCQDEAVLGVDFYVMRRVDGFIPRKELPEGMPADAATARGLAESAVDRLVELHALDPAPLADLGRGPGYARRQIDGWSERYRKARTWNVPSFEGVMRWLDARVPDDAGACVIHGDWRLDNLVFDRQEPTRVVGALDWEMATIGCPLMDLGNAMAYWVQADDDWFGRKLRRQPTHLPGMPTRAEFVARYLERSGRDLPSWAFYEVYGLFRLAVIVQQIYYRYHHGQVRNPQARPFWLFVHYLHRRCRRAMG